METVNNDLVNDGVRAQACEVNSSFGDVVRADLSTINDSLLWLINQVGSYTARADRADFDVVSTGFIGHCFAQAHDAIFGGTVSTRARPGINAANAGDVDDCTAVLFHSLQGGTAAKEGAAQIGVDNAIKFFCVHFFYVSTAANASIVDHNIRCSNFLNGLFKEMLNLCFFSDIGDYR